MTTEVETVSKNIRNSSEPISASTLRSNSRKQLNSTAGFFYTPFYTESVTPYYYPSVFINEEFDEFIKSLDIQNRTLIESSVKEIKSYPFVKSVDFDNHGIPTLIINLPEVNRDHEKKIYAIEYNLLKKIKVNIDFYIDFL